MRLIKIIKYKDTAIKIYNNGIEGFQYEYSFKQNGKLVKDRSSTSSVERCLELAKEDYDLESCNGN